MNDWRAAYRDWDWDAVDNWWRRSSDRVQLQALFKRLRADLPQTAIENGTEVDWEYQLPDNVSKEWHGAAMILYSGELEAKIEGDPPTDLQQWQQIQSENAATLHELSEMAEVTSGDERLSRRAHAQDALRLLSEADFIKAALLDPDGDEIDQTARAALQEHLSGIAIRAFAAGVHAEKAAGKEIENDAIRGGKVARGAREGAGSTARLHAAKRDRRIARMSELVPEQGIAQSARICESEGMGTAAAIRKQWYRHKDKHL